jgi:predicted  nucleic acid-binding Zn-ribbon protein
MESSNDRELLLKIIGMLEKSHDALENLTMEFRLVREEVERHRTWIADIEEKCAKRPTICGCRTPFPKLA